MNAGSGTNYPAALAGMLSVQADGNMVYQKYQTFDGSGTYQRTRYNANWYAWDKILDTGNAVAFTSADNTKLDGIETGATADQTITLSGDATGSGTGSIVVTVADDSHNHVWGNIDGASANGWGGLRNSTAHGYIDLGPANTTWAHIYTDRPNFYFNKGVSFQGNLTLTGTVEGRYIFSDGTKLDGIETGATADQTAAQLLAKIKTVDVNGSGGINAGRLDGHVLTTAATANTVVERNGSGDINARLFRSEFDTTNAGCQYFMTQINTGTNNHLRPSTLAQVRTKVVAGATAGSVGSYAYMIVTSANISVGVGSTRAGSGLRYSGQSTNSNSSSSGYNVGHTYSSAGGTWRAMGGRSQAGTYTYFATLWLRIS